MWATIIPLLIALIYGVLDLCIEIEMLIHTFSYTVNSRSNPTLK